MKNLNKLRKGGISQNQLIFLILLTTFIGIGIYYYFEIQSGRTDKPPVTTSGPFSCPVEEAIREATKKTNNLVYAGIPNAGKISLTILRNIGFYSGYSEEKRNPLWVAYKIDSSGRNYELKRPSGFKPDQRTFSRINPKDYKSSGYDRGHLAPNSAISSEYGKEAQLETFLMSNIVPQKPDLNRKVWQRLERLESEFAVNLETVWVFTGPIFDQHIQLIKNRIEVPDAFYKIIIDEQQGNIRTLAFLIPQSVSGRERLMTFITSIDEIEKLSGLDFLSPLSDENEDKLEAAVANSLW